MNLINICKHLLVRPDLLSDKMYRDQLAKAVQSEEQADTKGEPLPEWTFYHHSEKYGKTITGCAYVENLNPSQLGLLGIAFALANNCEPSEISCKQQRTTL